MLLRIFLFLLWLLAGVFHQALFVIFTLLGLFYMVSKDFRFSLNQITRSYLFYFLVLAFVSLLQIVNSQDLKVHNVEGLGRLFSYLMVALFLFALTLRDLQGAIRLILLYVGLSLPVGIFWFLQGERFSNVFVHPNHYGYVLVVLLYYVLEKSRGQGLSRWALAIVLLSILLTKSTGAILVAVLMIFVFIGMNNHLSALKKIYLFVIPFAGLVLAFLIFSDRLSSQFTDLIQAFNLDFIAERAYLHRPGGMGSGMWRLIYWYQILDEFLRESNFTIFVGIGLDALTKGNYAYHFVYTDPHNDYVKLFVEAGVLGLMTYFLFVVLILQGLYYRSTLLVLLLLPVFFGNILVNFPFNFTFLLVVAYQFKFIKHSEDQ